MDDATKKSKMKFLHILHLTNGCIDYLENNYDKTLIYEMETIVEVATEMISHAIINFTDCEEHKRKIFIDISNRIERKCNEKMEILKKRNECN